ncbi:MAG: thioredoxin family protein [Flavobacteriaceae bacterium]|nr:thioredoxin family protein [Flavobacteriaceae bacterium]
MKEIIKNSLKKSLTYQEYRSLVSRLLEKGKSTGPIQTEELTNYSLLNDKRMKRLDKTIKITDDTKAAVLSISKPQTWLVITEGWCGDAAQNLPVLHKLAELNKNVDLKLVLRDDNLELMDLYLTNGGRSIPKLIALNEELNELFTWGPRPSVAVQMVNDYKEKHGVLDASFKQDLQVWYNKNKGINLQEDFIKLLKS